MSISPTLLQALRSKSSQMVEAQTAALQVTEEDMLLQASKFIDAVPTLILQSMIDGANYVEIMPIREGHEFTFPTWKDRDSSDSPDPTWLKGVAVIVYAWCVESGLEPFISPYRGPERSTAGLIITWDRGRMQFNLDFAGAFLARLQAVSPGVQARNIAEQTRKRVRDLRTAITNLHSEINRVSRIGTRVRITGDIIDYCESLGLTVTSERVERVTEGPFRDHYFDTVIHASWEAGKPPLLTKLPTSPDHRLTLRPAPF